MVMNNSRKVIAVVNQKGGVGKTTTTINLAACLANKGVPILVVDFDPQFNTTSGLGQRNINGEKNVYRVLTDQIDIRDAIVQPFKNLHLLPSSPDLSGLEVELYNSEHRFSMLQQKLKPVLNDYGMIFIDCPPSLGMLTINALLVSDSILIPIQCEYYALEGLTQLLNTLDRIKQNLNPTLETEGILLTMCDMRTNLSHQVVNEVRGYFKDKVFETVIPRNVRLSEAPGFGKPIIEYDRHCQGAESYLSLANEFAAAHQGVFPPPPDQPPMQVVSDQPPIETCVN